MYLLYFLTVHIALEFISFLQENTLFLWEGNTVLIYNAAVNQT